MPNRVPFRVLFRVLAEEEVDGVAAEVDRVAVDEHGHGRAAAVECEFGPALDGVHVVDLGVGGEVLAQLVAEGTA